MLEKQHEVNKKYAKLVCENYVPLVLEYLKTIKNVYIPEDDFNFMMWSVVTYACKHKFYFKTNLDYSKHYY